MAIMLMNLYSRYLQRSVPVTVVMPVDSARFESDPLSPMNGPLKTIYLLNGYFGNNLDWLMAGDAKNFATKYNVAIVMPAGENKFYIDNAATGEQFGRFIGEELVQQTRRIFNLSCKREDTFIGGLSMGGYGALRNGLKYSETFGYIVALSAAIMDEKRLEAKLAEPDVEDMRTLSYSRRPAYTRALFGDLEEFVGGDNDLRALFLKAGSKAPKIYLACGTEDSLLEPNRTYRDFLSTNNADLMYEEGPGIHNFVFWKEYLYRAAENFLPVNTVRKAGDHSENVR